MKHVYFLIIFYLTFLSCSSDNFDELDLNETSWEGNIKIRSSKPEREYEIKISFNNEINGFYNITTDPFPMNDRYEEYYSKSSGFEYSLNKRTIFIHTGFKNILLGEWWIVDRKSDYIELRRNIESEKCIDILYI